MVQQVQLAVGARCGVVQPRLHALVRLEAEALAAAQCLDDGALLVAQQVQVDLAVLDDVEVPGRHAGGVEHLAGVGAHLGVVALFGDAQRSAEVGRCAVVVAGAVLRRVCAARRGTRRCEHGRWQSNAHGCLKC